MTSIEPLSCDLVTRTVNFHGHQLLKMFTSRYPQDLKGLNLKDVDYKVYKARLPEISKLSSSTRNELLHFMNDKCPNLFLASEIQSTDCKDDDNYGMEDRTNNLPPLEYFMKVMGSVKKDMFFKNVKRGDVLYVRVSTHSHDLLSVVKVQAALDTRFWDLMNSDIKAHLRMEDSDPDPTDKDGQGRWMLRTRLAVEVLEVDASDYYLLVGTKGVAIHPYLKDKVKLGKSTLSSRPPLLRDMEEGNVKSYSQVLNNLTTFNNPRSIRHLAGKFNIDLYSHSSLMATLKHKFTEREMYKSVRKAQMSRWAHKSVADGVVFFKRGQHEEAFQCLNKALQIDSENVEAFVAKGALLANFGSLEKAVENFEEALKHNPSHNNAQKYICETLVELGKQFEEENKMEEAEKNFRKCLSINPEHAGGKEALRKITQKSGNRAEIVEDVLQDLMDIEEEFHRKFQRAPSVSKTNPMAKKERSPEAESEGSLQASPDPGSQRKSRSRSKSLSPLSKKLQMQEGKWQPPATINTTASFMPNLAIPPPNVAVPPPNVAVPPPNVAVPPNANMTFSYPPVWPPPTTMVGSSTLPAMYPPLPTAFQPPATTFQQPPPTTYQPPSTSYPVLPQATTTSSSTYASQEDEEYKARVDKFLKDIEGVKSSEKKDVTGPSEKKDISRPVEKKDASRLSEKRETSKKRHSKGKDSRSRKKLKDSHKKRNRSSSSSSGSRNSSHSSRSSSSSSTSSSSSSSSSSSRSTSTSSSNSRSSSRNVDSKKKRHRKHKKQKKPSKKRRKAEKHSKKEVVKEKYEKVKSKTSNISTVEDDAIPGLDSLNEKLTAYYKKLQESQREQPVRENRQKEKEAPVKEREKRSKEKETAAREREKRSKGKDSQQKERSSDDADSFSQMMAVKKSYEQGFRLTSKTKVGSNSALTTKGVHPAFQESDEDDILDQPASSTLKTKQIDSEKDAIGRPELNMRTSSGPSDSSVSKKRSPSPSPRRSSSKDRSRSRSRKHSRSQSRSFPRSYSRSRSRSRGRYRSHSRSLSRHRSRSPRGRYMRSRSRSPHGHHSKSRSYGRMPRRGRPYHRGNTFRRSRSRDRDDYHGEGSRRHRPYYNRTRSPFHHYGRFQGRGRFSGRRGGPPNRDSRDSASFRDNRGGNWEKKDRYRERDSPEPLTEREREMMVQTARKKLEEGIKFGAVDPEVWEHKQESLTSSLPGSPKAEPSFPKTPSRWESSQSKPSRWESSCPKTPSRWESSRPKTPSRWDSSRPKTPSRWESSRPKTPSRWESTRPKTPSRWESSRPKTPSRWDSSHPKTPSRWESSRPKTPSRLDSSRPKTPSHRNSHDYSERREKSSHSVGESPIDRAARFGKWDTDEKEKNGDSKIGDSLSEMETFIEIAKQKRLEEMKERNKAFLKPTID